MSLKTQIDDGEVTIEKSFATLVSFNVDQIYDRGPVCGNYLGAKAELDFYCSNDPVLTFVTKDGVSIKVVCQRIKVEAKPTVEGDRVTLFKTENDNGSNRSEVQSPRERDAERVCNDLF